MHTNNASVTMTAEPARRNPIPAPDASRWVGSFRSDIDPKIATFGILGMCNWLSQWYRPGGAYNPQQIAHFFSQLAEFGLVVPDSNPSAETNI